MKTLPNALLIEGHTDATQYSSDADYSNWELSADRANSARRLMQQDGVRSDQVTQVRGYADQMLRVKNNPYDPSNRRISILVKNEGTSQPAPDHGTVVDEALAPSTGESKSGVARSGPGTPAAEGKPPSAPAAKPSFMARLKRYIPGKPDQQQR